MLLYLKHCLALFSVLHEHDSAFILLYDYATIYPTIAIVGNSVVYNSYLKMNKKVNNLLPEFFTKHLIILLEYISQRELDV